MRVRKAPAFVLTFGPEISETGTVKGQLCLFPWET